MNEKREVINNVIFSVALPLLVIPGSNAYFHINIFQQQFFIYLV